MALDSGGVGRSKPAVDSVTSKLASLSTNDGKNVAPARPSHGSQGNQNTVLVNYFPINITETNDYIFHRHKITFEFQSGTEQGKPLGIPSPERVAKGRKLKALFGDLIRQVAQGGIACTSDFKGLLVSRKEISPPDDGYQCKSEDAARRRIEHWKASIGTHQMFNMQALLRYLQGRPGQLDGMSLKEINDHISTIGVVIAHAARDNVNIVNVGQSRFFGVSTGQNAQGAFAKQRWSPEERVARRTMVEVLRGYFQSVRPATGGLMLNVNVTYGVFRLGSPHTLAQMLQRKGLGLRSFSQANDNEARAILSGVDFHDADRWIKGVLVDYRTPSGSLLPRKVAGLATNQDGRGELPGQRPIFRDVIGSGEFCYAGGARDVRICIKAPTSISQASASSLSTSAASGASGQLWQRVYDYQDSKRNFRGGEVNVDLPLVNIGSRDKPVYVFAEHCIIRNNQYTKTKLDDDDQKAMVTFAVKNPHYNQDLIGGKGRLLLGLDASQTRSNLGVQVGQRLIEVMARTLKPPERRYRKKVAKGSNQALVSNGVFVSEKRAAAWDVKDRLVWKAPTPTASIDDKLQWSFIHFNNTSQGGARITEEIVNGLVPHLRNQMGINLETRPFPIPPSGAPGPVGPFLVSDTDKAALAERMEKFKALRPVPVLFVVLPNGNASRYGNIKRFADLDGGFHTVCLQETKPKGPQYWANIGLKVNLKMGGTNHVLRDMSLGTLNLAETMIVGYDVIHPTNRPPKDDETKSDAKDGSEKASTKGKGTEAVDDTDQARNKTARIYPPSIVAMVASRDGDLAQWPSTSWANPSGQEQVDGKGFENAIERHLVIWAKAHGQFPKNIIVFRDGVSESQHDMCRRVEIPCLRDACEKLRATASNASIKNGPLPRITFVIAVKRHQTRLYPKPKSVRKTPAGTIVDKGITQDRSWDFYLQAHDAIQGTPRPAHYVVLEDEVLRQDNGKQGAVDILETLTHGLSYAFGRATRSVSLCTPAYYADIVCTRAKLHRQELFDKPDAISAADRARIDQQQVHQNLRDTMYYL